MHDDHHPPSTLELIETKHWDTLPKPLMLFLNTMVPDLVVFDDDGVSPYLGREYITSDFLRDELELPRLMWHWFFRGDHDRELHSHPWRWSLSLVIWGGYLEERFEEGTVLEALSPIDAEFEGESPAPLIVTRRVGPLSLNLLRHDTFHRVKLLRAEGCLTLFLAGPKMPGADADDNWGFVSRDGKTYETANERDARVRLERGLPPREPKPEPKRGPSLRRRIEGVARAAAERAMFVPAVVVGLGLLAVYAVTGADGVER